jgi:copper transport protein
VRRALIGVVVALTALVALAGPAAAHATLESTTPAAGAVLTSSPSQITLQFDEHVEIALGAVRLYDGTGREVDVGTAHHPGGTQSDVAVAVPNTLRDGVYIVSWRVVSDDSHPVHGAFTFQMGAGAAAPAPGLLDRLLAADGGNPAAGAVLGMARFFSYAGVALVLGGLAFLTVGWPDGARRRRLRVLLWVALAMGTVATLIAIAVQAPYASGRAVTDALHPDQWWQVLRTRSGRAWGVRAVVFAAVGGLLLITVDRLRERWWRVIGVVTALGVLVLVADAGHGTTGRWPVVGSVATVAHVGAMSVWLGGLVVVLVGIVAWRSDVAGSALDVVRRFSGLAFAAMTVIVVSGVVQAYRQVGSVDALTSTTYGRLLIAKTVAVAVVLALAYAARRLVWAGPAAAPVAAAAGAAVLEDAPPVLDDPDRRQVRRLMIVEVAVAAVILAITSLLVATVPAIAQETKPFNVSIVQGQRLASITVDPARRGRNALHVYIITPGGSLDKADEITVQVSLPSRDLGPIPVPVEDAGPNHVTTDNLLLPFSGRWQLVVLARFGNTDQIRFATAFTVP